MICWARRRDFRPVVSPEQHLSEILVPGEGGCSSRLAQRFELVVLFLSLAVAAVVLRSSRRFPLLLPRRAALAA
ncbi:MAG: hypothetical protein AAF368_18615, partial [Planctomycetota bacterium]